MSTSSSDCDYSLWRHRNSCMSTLKFAFELCKTLSGLSCLSVYLSRYEIRDIHLVEESVLESLKVKADFHNFKPRPFNMREFYDRTGHDINDMLLSCHFHGTECRPEDFKVVSCLFLSICCQQNNIFFDRFLKFYIFGRNKSVWESVVKRCVDGISPELSLESHTAHLMWCLNSCVQTTHFL